MEQEILIRLSMLQQEAEKVQEQLNLINQKIAELNGLHASLQKTEKDSEMLAHLGNGIFVKSEVKDEKFFVSVGSGIVVKKTAKEAGEFLQKQILQLEELKGNLMTNAEMLNAELFKIVNEAQGREK